jgi:hypothetical protein
MLKKDPTFQEITRRDNNGYRDFIEYNMRTYDKDNCH